MRHATAVVELLDGRLNLVELPALGLDERGDSFGREERLGSPRAFGECLKLFLRIGLDAYGQRCGHVY